MKDLKWVAISITAIAWGLIYFLIGAAFSFTLGSTEFWTGAIVYLALFLLPLPISLAAIWFPKTASLALICCAAISLSVAFVSGVYTETPSSLVGLCKFVGWHIPHIVLAVVYMRQAKSKKDNELCLGGFH